MEEWKTRTAALIGEKAVEILAKSKVAVFGVGGVGGHVAEALIRSGIGNIALVDGDKFAESNLNRQLFATTKTLGMSKTAAAKERLLSISPNAEVKAFDMFFTEKSEFDFGEYDYVIDAIDTISSKMEIIKRCKAEGVSVICSMGAGNKLNPMGFKVADIYKTSVCPLARVMRKLCKDNGIESLKVVYSEELPATKLRTPASIAFVPSACGLLIASEVVKDLCRTL